MTNVTAAFYFNRANHRAVGLEYSFDAFTMRYLAHSKRRIQTAITLGNDDPFKRLQSLTGVPSFTFTCTTTVSPGEKSGISLVICSCSSASITLLITILF